MGIDIASWRIYIGSFLSTHMASTNSLSKSTKATKWSSYRRSTLLIYFYYYFISLNLLCTVNQFSTHFRYCVSTFSYKHMPQCKFSLYLKKAGLASRNIVHFLKKLELYDESCSSYEFWKMLFTVSGKRI